MLTSNNSYKGDSDDDDDDRDIRRTTSKARKAHYKERDIIPGKYYGGLKVWSCAPMLARYLVANEQLWRTKWSQQSIKDETKPSIQRRTRTKTECDDNHTSNEKRLCQAEKRCVVMEVGCGQGLCGLVALCLGAKHVIFQDYNQQVLTSCVQPNIAATLLNNKFIFQSLTLQTYRQYLQQHHHHHHLYQHQKQQQQLSSISTQQQQQQQLKQLQQSSAKMQICNTRPNVEKFTTCNSNNNIYVKLVDGDWANMNVQPLTSIQNIHTQFAINDDDNNHNLQLQSNHNTESSILQSDMCDVILGSDVTFDEEACAKLAALLQRVLKPKTGIALIASKQYYFGTNGGVWQFTQQVTARNLCVKEVYRATETQTAGMQQVIVQVTKS